jgi:hypothetical protein
MKASVANAAGRDASPSGTTPDTRASIIICWVTQGMQASPSLNRRLSIRRGHRV